MPRPIRSTSIAVAGVVAGLLAAVLPAGAGAAGARHPAPRAAKIVAPRDASAGMATGHRSYRAVRLQDLDTEI